MCLFRYSAVHLLISAKELSFHLGIFEPFFCTLALYDLKNKLKISEVHRIRLLCLLHDYWLCMEGSGPDKQCGCGRICTLISTMRPSCLELWSSSSPTLIR